MKKIETDKEIIVFIKNNNIAVMPSDQFLNGKASVGIFIVDVDTEENINIDVAIGSIKNIVFYNTEINKHFKFKFGIKNINKNNKLNLLKKLNSLKGNLIDTPDKMKTKFAKLLLNN
jgi:hypothetical protein